MENDGDRGNNSKVVGGDGMENDGRGGKREGSFGGQRIQGSGFKRGRGGRIQMRESSFLAFAKTPLGSSISKMPFCRRVAYVETF